ncbi:MAG: hypothetical protein V3W18_07275, partial [candidate division Zixibacteria bacterium]
MKIIKISLTVLVFIGFTYSLSSAQMVESLYADSSFSSMPIDSAANCYGPPDGTVAHIDSNLANYEIWTFDFDSTFSAGLPIISSQIFITHYQAGWVDDTLVIEYFDG